MSFYIIFFTDPTPSSNAVSDIASGPGGELDKFEQR